MTHPEDMFSTHSTPDDEESLKTGLLDGSSSIRVERQRGTKMAAFFRLYFLLLHVVLLALILFMIQRIHPNWETNHELMEGSTWCMLTTEPYKYSGDS